jgi:hypothetical protein
MLGFLSGGTCGFTFRIPKTAAGETGILNNSQTKPRLKNRRNKAVRIPDICTRYNLEMRHTRDLEKKKLYTRMRSLE